MANDRPGWPLKAAGGVTFAEAKDRELAVKAGFDLHMAKAVLSRFTPGSPLIVPAAVLDQLREMPELAGMLDRVAASEEMPDA